MAYRRAEDVLSSRVRMVRSVIVTRCLVNLAGRLRGSQRNMRHGPQHGAGDVRGVDQVAGAGARANSLAQLDYRLQDL
jgi:hypothetical protein